MALDIQQKVVPIVTAILLILIFFPFQERFYHDMATLAGTALLTIAIYMLFLLFMTSSTVTRPEDIEAEFANLSGRLILENKSQNVNMNYLELQIDPKEIRVQTLPDLAQARMEEMKRALTFGAIFSPAITFGIILLRRLFLPTEVFFLYFMTGILYLALILLMVLMYLSFKEVPDERKDLLQIVKRGTDLEISVLVSDKVIKEETGIKHMVIRIPQDRFKEDLYLSSLTESLDKSSDQLSTGMRLLHNISKKVIVFPQALAIDLDSEYVEILQKPERKEGHPELQNPTFLMFGVHDTELVHTLKEQIANWANQ